jgi:hypothetical protein
MKNRRRVTEEDLLVTEALIAQSYGRLKRSVIQVPTRAFTSMGKTVREHPYATAAAAVVAGAVVYGITKKMTSHAPAKEAPGRSRGARQKDTGRPDLLYDMLLMILPLAAPYVAGYIQKYLGTILSGERD